MTTFKLRLNYKKRVSYYCDFDIKANNNDELSFVEKTQGSSAIANIFSHGNLTDNKL